VVGIETPEDAYPSLSIAGALGWGFLTAIATGPFGTLLLVMGVIVADPAELIDKPLEILGSLLSLLTVGSVFAILIAVIIGWLPISLVGWLIQKAAGRWLFMNKRAAWAGVGALAGGLCLALVVGTIEDVIVDPQPADWEMLGIMSIFGGGCGLFAALFFRWLITPARRSP
jgi:hypothetical protein